MPRQEAIAQILDRLAHEPGLRSLLPGRKPRPRSASITTRDCVSTIRDCVSSGVAPGLRKRATGCVTMKSIEARKSESLKKNHAVRVSWCFRKFQQDGFLNRRSAVR